LKIKLISATLNDIQTAFDLLHHTSENLEQKGISQWLYWQNPPQEKIDWVQAGFEANEFYWIKNESNDLMGMVRVMNKDELYWGEHATKAKYIHSLVVHTNFAGQQIGKQVIDIIEKMAKDDRCDYLRLDCDATNKKLCAYYTQQRFEKVGERKLPLGTYNLYQRKI